MEKIKKRLGIVSGEAYFLGLLVFVLLNLDNEWVVKDCWLTLGLWFVVVALCIGEIALAVYEGLDSPRFWGAFSSTLIVQSTVLLFAGGFFVIFGHPRENLLATNIFLHPTSGMLCVGLLLLGLSYFCKVVEKNYATNSPPKLVFDGYDLAAAFTLICFSMYLGGTIYVLPLQFGTVEVLSLLVVMGAVATVVLGVVKLIAEFWRRKR